MKLIKPAALLVLSAALIAVIFMRFAAEPDAGEQNTQSVESRAVEIYREDWTTPEYKDYKQIKAYFLVPADFTYEEAKAHFKEYAEAMKAEYGYIGALKLRYFDDEAYIYNTPTAIVDWSPYLRESYREDNVEIGDYSKHTLWVEITDYNADYELDEEEKLLYTALQEYSIAQTGLCARPYSSVDTLMGSTADYYVFDHIAGQYQTTLKRLLEICRKAFGRRMYIIETPVTG